MADSADMSSEAEGGNANGNGLVLYHHYVSFHSQKVVLALLEKKLKFKSHIVNVFRGETLQPWFFQMNPEAKIPVLKDGVKIIPDSGRIIDYLEDNFSNGDTPKLMPGKGTLQYQKMKELQEKLDSFQSFIVTSGTICHPELAKNSKITAAELKLRKHVATYYQKMLMVLSELSVDNPDAKKIYESKMSESLENIRKTQDIEEVKKALQHTESLLDDMEEELRSHQQEQAGWWLCDEKFTVADIYLILMLLRLDQLGLWTRYFGEGQRPHLRNYYQRARQREAFKKLVFNPPGLIGTLCDNKCAQTAMAAVLGTATVVGLIAAAAIVYKRIK